MSEFDQRVFDYFGNEAVSKRRMSLLKKQFGQLIPNYVFEPLVQTIAPGRDVPSPSEYSRIHEFISTHLPGSDNEADFKNRIYEGSEVRIIGLVQTRVELKQNKHDRFAVIPNLGLERAEIEGKIIDSAPDELKKEGVWGKVKLSTLGEKLVHIVKFEPFQQSVNLPMLESIRTKFSVEEWIRLLIGSAGFEAEKLSHSQRMLVLLRLCTLAQPSLNFMELGPKQTGKTFLYRNISPAAFVVNGSEVTVAKLFYNDNTRREGYIYNFKVVALDEVQHMAGGADKVFALIDSLKGYLEDGTISKAGNIKSDCSFVLLANIECEDDPLTNAFLPKDPGIVNSLHRAFLETAFLDRFNGIIPGWKMPKLHDQLFYTGAAINADFFARTLKALRRANYSSNLIESRVKFSPETTKRDCDRIKQTARALCNLVFLGMMPSNEELETFCLKPAIEVRQLVRDACYYRDVEFQRGPKEIKAWIEE